MSVMPFATQQMPGRPLGTSYGMEYGPLTVAGPSMEWILGTLERRRQERGPVLEAMRLIRDAYNGDIIIPLPEMAKNERPAVANLIVTGIDQTAQRIASVMPSVDCPPLRRGIKVSEEKARTRTMAVQSWWDANRMPAKMRRRARWLIGYASAPAVIRPHYTKDIPCWEIRDPLSSYPAPTQDPDDICPPDAIFTYFKSWAWLRNVYPVAMAQLVSQAGNFGTKDIPGNLQFELVEYVDAECTVLLVLGQKQWGNQYMESMGLSSGSPSIELERVPNRTGMCPAVVPQRITLDRPKGQFDDAVGMYESNARMMALHMIAVERGIFPDTFLIGRQGETPQFISGPHDGRSGMVNVVSGGDVKDLTLNPGVMTNNVMDRLERNERVTSGVPSEYGGESPSNVRTGKRGDAIMTAVTSFPVQEAQEVLAAALEEENRRAIAVDRAYFGNRRKSFYLNVKGGAQAVEYVPNEVFEIDANKVTYAMTGTDQNGLVVGGGQRVGLGTMSKRSFMEIDPMVADAELEHDRVIGEALEAAVLASLQAQAQEGQIPPGDIARIAELVVSNKAELFGAIATAQREAQERQANAGPQGAPTGPALPGSPEAQPGLAQPGAGAEVPTTAAPPQGLSNVSDFLQSLRG
jgi:hypothetical protein